MTPKRCDSKIKRLIMNLRDNKNYSYKQIVAYLKMFRDGREQNL